MILLSALQGVVLALGVAAPALAQDYVTTQGLLPDDAFYRLVACAAPPGGACAKPMLRWPATRPVSAGIVRIDRAFLGGRQARARAALTRAVQYLDDAAFGLTLRETDSGDPDIRIHFLDTDGTEPLRGTGIPGMDGVRIRGARVGVKAMGGTITQADIVFGTKLPIEQYESAMIEEVAQALGLLTDIRNPAYDGVSIFAEDSNASKRPGAQDIMALRRHYDGEVSP